MSTNAEDEMSEARAKYMNAIKYDIPMASVECLMHGPNLVVWCEARGYYCCWWCLKERGLV